MVWVISVSAVVLVAILAVVFARNARAIRRDVDERFTQVQAQLEEEANEVVENILSRHRRT